MWKQESYMIGKNGSIESMEQKRSEPALKIMVLMKISPYLTNGSMHCQRTPLHQTALVMCARILFWCVKICALKSIPEMKNYIKKCPGKRWKGFIRFCKCVVCMILSTASIFRSVKMGGWLSSIRSIITNGQSPFKN